ncbi:nuclease [Georgenia sp. EYE_87]|uniref:nuclease n=1 Tax=Georgenia sp. EYE_87 TaxID=2853448 RepID=UPI0020064AD0|nr:nuclease [Georgenia sp. EYE_87]MCK6211055.1 nuclease [Georgenia sp. EYE_87]
MLNRTLFDVLPIQEVVANASPSAWRDGLVVSQGPGALTVMLLDGQEGTLVTGATPEVGEPVAIHPVAEVVAVGGTWYSARPLVGADGGAS